MSNRTRKNAARSYLDTVLKQHEPFTKKAKRTYWKLMNTVRDRSVILKAIPSNRCCHRYDVRTLVFGCRRIASYPKQWIRPLETWQPEGDYAVAQFRSLMSHLFEEYPAPNHLALSWINLYYSFEPWYIELYLHMAKGLGIRQYSGSPLPLELNRSAAIWFNCSPDDLDPEFALEWSLVRSWGGDEKVARLFATECTFSLKKETARFWESAIRFLMKYMPITDQEVLEIILFLNQQKYEPAEDTWGRGGGAEPLQPGFSLKGRTLKSLRRHMIHWREELLAKRPELGTVTHDWQPMEVGSLQFQEDGTQWTIEELTNDKSLIIEGTVMQNCVGDYVRNCTLRQSSIWSMRAGRNGYRKRICTIEVSPDSRVVVQFKAKANSSPSDKCREVLKQWAEREGLVIGIYC